MKAAGGMAGTLGDRLTTARRTGFVGRQDELARFAALLRAADPAVVAVSGPPGIGKSTLVRELAALSRDRGCAVLLVDARDLPPGPEGLAAALAPAVSASAGRVVVLLDTYELLADLDGHLRDRLAPRLPADAILVLAGQQPPTVGWRSDPGWSAILHQLQLTELSATECHDFLAGHGFEQETSRRAIAFTHGHPLALALAAEVLRTQGSVAALDSADVVHDLVERLLSADVTADRRSTVEAASQVRIVNEAVLGALLGSDDVRSEFAWLRSLPFTTSGPSGLHLHELVRDVVAADLRWRDPPRYAAYHDRARRFYLTELTAGDPQTQIVALLDLIYLHPDLRVFLQPSAATAALRVGGLTDADAAAVAAWVGRYEGPESGRLAEHWLAHRPGSWLVVREADGSPAGAVCFLDLSLDPTADGAVERRDPAVVAAYDDLRSRSQPRTGEVVTLIRYWLSRDDYQSVSPVQSLIATQFARHFLTTPGLAVTYLPFAEPERWEAFCRYADQQRAPLADFHVGDRRFTSYVHDWRTSTPADWLARMSHAELGREPPATPAGREPLVLDEAAFAAAVRQALRDFSRPDRLLGSPLLRCRLVADLPAGRSGAGAERVAALRQLLREAVEALGQHEADQRLQRVLVRAYLNPAATLERAAEVLELPSSTFRRLLATGVGRVAAALWQRELADLGSATDR